MWFNGLGVALLFSVALGLLPSALSPYWLRLPLALFLAGMMLALMGLFWAGMLRLTVARQQTSGYARRTYWIPALFAIISYFFALIAFAAACWAFLGVASLSHYHNDIHSGMGQRSVPGLQHHQNWQDDHSNIKYTQCA